MFAIAFIAFLAVACIVAGFYGVDSRVDERARRVH
jgi:hypothetical protein